MPTGICRLCKSEADLQLSHVVPGFVFRWLRDSSGNGYMRGADSPNLRVQDGPQKHWLCLECEARLGRSETAFATELFHPYLAESGRRFRYGAWLLRFCVSVSWRNLLIQLEHLQEQDFTEKERGWVTQAEMAWRQFLLDEAPHPGAFRQFLLPLDRIESNRSDLPPNINRYLMRAIDIDLCHGGQALFTYTKLGRFVILGFINEPNPSHWIGGRVGANEGTIEPRSYTLPAPFGTYLMGKAGRVREAMQGISDRQKAKIEQAFRANADQIVGSDFFNAMQADVKMFGSAAFTPQDHGGER
jgi:hypothetical protein